MRVLFLNPPFHPRFSREQRSPAVTKSGTLYYPKWLATAAGVAIKNGHEVDLVDSPAAGQSVQGVIHRINAKNIEAVVCDTSTPSILNDVSVMESLIAAKPSLQVLMVGRHVSSLPRETLAMSPALEAVAIREYEYTVRDWLAQIFRMSMAWCGGRFRPVKSLRISRGLPSRTSMSCHSFPRSINAFCTRPITSMVTRYGLS
jgi:anaerobic magnesium-protoporphyrin IX monomethyl ester cyclase